MHEPLNAVQRLFECGAAIVDVYDRTLMGVKSLSAIAIAIELI